VINSDPRFFIDHCIPESVAKVIEAEGMQVIRLRTKTATDAPDPLVAALAEANDAVLVTMDSDFKTIARRVGIGQRRYKKLSLLRFERCREAQFAHRLKTAVSLIRHEWAFGNGKHDRRMFVVITAAAIRTHR
jgi:predicted nuclease of predicted toxin-antitoxin system